MKFKTHQTVCLLHAGIYIVIEKTEDEMNEWIELSLNQS